MLESGTDPESNITEYTSVYTDHDSLAAKARAPPDIHAPLSVEFEGFIGAGFEGVT